MAHKKMLHRVQADNQGGERRAFSPDRRRFLGIGTEKKLQPVAGVERPTAPIRRLHHAGIVLSVWGPVGGYAETGSAFIFASTFSRVSTGIPSSTSITHGVEPSCFILGGFKQVLASLPAPKG
jgi:hypothetical protein